MVEIEPEATIENQTMGSCIEEGLQSSQLLVSGENGCNRFYEGMTAHAKDQVLDFLPPNLLDSNADHFNFNYFQAKA